MTPNPSINRTCPGKPGHAGYLKRWASQAHRRTSKARSMSKIVSFVLLTVALASVASPSSAQSTTERATRDASKSYQPQPWVAGQTKLPPRYPGTDIKWLYKLLSKYSERPSKSDFETTKEYEERTRVHAALPSPLAADKEYAFRIEAFELMHQLRYDAEAEEFHTGQFGMICLDADKNVDFQQALVVCEVGDLERREDEYVGSNAYGAKRDIERRREHNFGLAIDKANELSKKFLKGHQGFQDRFAMPRARARLLEGKRIGVLFVGMLHDPHLVPGQPTIIRPTISNPSDIRVTRIAVKFRPTRLVYFTVETGEVLFERNL
jgi:hypothetical protein